MDGLLLDQRMAEQGRMPKWLRAKMGWTMRQYQRRRMGSVVLTVGEVTRLRALLIEDGDPLPLERLYDPARYTPRP